MLSTDTKRKEKVMSDTQTQSGNMLELVTTVTLPAIQTFSTRESFLTNSQSSGGVSYVLGYNFRNSFLDKVEVGVPKMSFRIHKLLRNTFDTSIITELGGENGVEVYLAHVWMMLEAQGQGQHGSLLTNTFTNIFYVRDVRSWLWAIRCRWYSDRGWWNVRAYSQAHPSEWYGDQVCTR